MDLKNSYKASAEMADLLDKLQNNISMLPGYTFQEGLILKKGRLVLVLDSTFKNKVLDYLHVDP